MAPASRTLFSRDDAGRLPGLRRLELAPDTLPDGPLLGELSKRRGAGRDGYPVEAMWRATVAGVVPQA